MSEKALFIPLKREYYEAFADGSKTTEYRRHERGWNEKNCRIGRKVVLSLGYGKQSRMNGIVRSFQIVSGKDLSGVKDVYGTDDIEIAAIGIDIIKEEK